MGSSVRYNFIYIGLLKSERKLVFIFKLVLKVRVVKKGSLNKFFAESLSKIIAIGKNKNKHG